MAAATKRFVAHGSLTAKLMNEDGSDDSVQLSLAFLAKRLRPTLVPSLLGEMTMFAVEAVG